MHKPNNSSVDNTYAVNLSVLENETSVGDRVVLQSWFVRSGAVIIRSEVYRFEGGSVVAYQDCVNGTFEPLHMDITFKDLYEGQPEFDRILACAGVDKKDLVFYYTGR